MSLKSLAYDLLNALVNLFDKRQLRPVPVPARSGNAVRYK